MACDTPGIAVLRFARPPVNLVDLQLAQEIAAAVADVGQQPEVAAVVVHGDARIFCAGDETAELAGWTAEQAGAAAADFQHAVAALARLPQPTVAAISGYCLGTGLALALGADRRIIGDNVKLGLPQIGSGLIPLAGLARLRALVGPQAAQDLVFTGRFVDHQEALAMGLVDAVVAPDAVFSAAMAWAQQFVGGPTRALAAAKRALADPDPDDCARNAWGALFDTEDVRVGMYSWLAHGPGSAEFAPPVPTAPARRLYAERP